ncbi:carbohydrate ABC transporter permease [Paenibacillus nasutitermitis]|uniref:Sugar ABC transporter permease n=1 Tax=Paenibacillus nasutitermitis TaxID=1652958 RepID=A0A916YUV1_9BACL|nr:carbohydrate ABC transporter permease [Paenibacillus nasutitermitis]GGD62181.1 sugar ABC transporter permease [Paenibacillus nasutitermitis]
MVRKLQYLVLYFATAAISIPVLNIILSSFKTNEEINRVFTLPASLNFSNYIRVFESSSVLMNILNSLAITGSAILIAIYLTSMASYSLARRAEAFFQFLYLVFISAAMIPVAANLVPLYVLINKLGLVDTRTAIVLISTAGAIPMGILLYTGFIKGIPRSLEESASIDGYGNLSIFLKIILPLLKPVTVTYAVISTIGIWNDFLMPLLFIRTESKKTITLAVYSFMSEYVNDWGAIYALLTIAFIIPVLFFILNQKHFYHGVTDGAVKM